MNEKSCKLKEKEKRGFKWIAFSFIYTPIFFGTGVAVHKWDTLF